VITKVGDNAILGFFAGLFALMWAIMSPNAGMAGRIAAGSFGLVALLVALVLHGEDQLEGEAGDAVGRDYYEHGAQAGRGYRNGYRTGRLKTAEGLVESKSKAPLQEPDASQQAYGPDGHREFIVGNDVLNSRITSPTERGFRLKAMLSFRSGWRVVRPKWTSVTDACQCTARARQSDIHILSTAVTGQWSDPNRSGEWKQASKPSARRSSTRM
jgi:hypothetical protein